jgi:methionyl-tRNA synthetase
MPETKDNDFTWKDFQARNNNELVAILGNFVNRALVLTHKYFNGRIPERGVLNEYDKQTLEDIGKLKQAVEDNLENFRFRDALKAGMDLARLGNKYLADTEPWKMIKTDQERVKTILHISLQITANLTIMLEPFLPFTTAKLAGYLNLGKLSWHDAGNTALLKSRGILKEPGLLFEKIEDDIIEKQLQKLHKTCESKPVSESVVNPPKADISYDDFLKMDIRIATVLEATRVPKTDKLMQLRINTGMDERTVISGIAGYFKPEDLIGKQVCLLANLEPRVIKGISSHGMILLAEDTDGRLILVTPLEDTANGSEVK